MAKTQEELNALKKEVETLNNKLKELTDEELKQVAGGHGAPASNLPLNNIIREVNLRHKYDDYLKLK